MPSHADLALEFDLRCLPGDVTVTKIHTGYLIGRALEQQGSGPWWEYIAIAKTYREAYEHATRLAHEYGRDAWLHKHGDDYGRLSVPGVDSNQQ